MVTMYKTNFPEIRARRRIHAYNKSKSLALLVRRESYAPSEMMSRRGDKKKLDRLIKSFDLHAMQARKRQREIKRQWGRYHEKEMSKINFMDIVFPNGINNDKDSNELTDLFGKMDI